jgi:glycosyltransferase involved in cell wall biosynthesis
MKHKIVLLSDHPLSTSGVGTQARILIDGLIKTGKYSFNCLGAAIKHGNYDTVMVNQDLVIKPIDGFGTKEMLRQILVTQKPDAILLFTDPRQFIWAWDVEDEIHQVCPIAYWHVWDNGPYPEFNDTWYESTDLINCLSDSTYELVKPRHPSKTNYIPHSWPKELFHQINEEEVKQLKEKFFGPMKDWFMALWVNRNAHRKLPADLMHGWKLFLDKLEAKTGKKEAFLLMHTDPSDFEGVDLFKISEMLKIKENVIFSNQQVEFSQLNMLYNTADTTVNVSRAEGFGLATLSSLFVGKPIIANMTGGLTSQVKDRTTGFEYGVGIKPAVKTLIGNPANSGVGGVPYIYDDYPNVEDIGNAFYKLWEMGPEKRKELGTLGKKYVEENFSYEKMINDWDVTLEETIKSFKQKQGKNRWNLIKLKENYVEQETIKQLPLSPFITRTAAPRERKA